MRSIRLATLLLSIAVLLSIPIFLASCGGGGDGGDGGGGVTYVNSKATGTYHFVFLMSGGASTVEAQNGRIVFDGNGHATWYALSTTVSETSGTLAYTVTSNNVITFDGEMIGTMRADGSFIAATMTVNNSEGMLVATKLSSSVTDTANAYSAGQFSWDGRSSAEIIQIDMATPGAGVLTWAVSAPVSTLSGTVDYSLSADGSFSAPTATPVNFGAITADGELLIMGDAEDAADVYRNAICGFKVATSATLTTLNGSYIIHEFMDDNISGGGSIITSRGLVTFDGNGNGTHRATASSTGTVSPGTDPFTYTVSSNGSFLITAGTDTMSGVVLQDGSVLGLVDYDYSDNSVSVIIGVKQ